MTPPSVRPLPVTALFVLAWTATAWTQEEPVRVTSPDGQVEIQIAAAPALTYRVSYRGQPVILDSALGLEFEGQPPLAAGLTRVSATSGGADQAYRVVAGKANPMRDHHRSARVEFREAGGAGRRLGIEARAFDDGVAFRYILPGHEHDAPKPVKITRERTEFRLAQDATTYPLILKDFATSYEDEYQRRAVSGLHPDWLIGLPLLAELPGVAWLAIAEAHIENYAGMYLRHGSGSFSLAAHLAPRRDRPDVAVIAEAPLESPWRVVMLGREPGRLVESNILLHLNPPSAIADTSWIRPGKTSWDWWSGGLAADLPSQPGTTNESIRHFIDFSAASGFPYMLIDEGWAARRGEDRSTGDILTVQPAVDMPAILRYAQDKGVKLWLWAHWASVDRQMDEAFPLFERWGIAGVKIDFMDRDDQEMVDYDRRVLRAAARHHLMIDFHGAYKNDGIERTYPNQLTREGVMGLEYLKWSARVTPVHNCTLPFTRMLAGPMDYTPGGFLDVTREEFTPRQIRPMVLGTRAHQLALYVVFESHLQMVSDSPGRYEGQEDFAFIRAVPTTWDQTRVLLGRPMESIAVARRSGDEWYVGCLTNWDARDLQLRLDFLGDGPYVAEIYADAPDADTHPTHTAIRRADVDQATTLPLHLASGGGAALRIHPAGGH